MDIFRAAYFLINISLCYLEFLLEPSGVRSLTNKAKGSHSVATIAQYNAWESLKICLLCKFYSPRAIGESFFKIFTVIAISLNEIITIVLWACLHLAFLEKNASIHYFRNLQHVKYYVKCGGGSKELNGSKCN